MIDEWLSRTTATSDTHPPRRWGILGWASWLPEIINVGVVGIAAFGAVANLISFSDDAIRQGLIDTYEPSAWTFLVVCVFAVVGIALALFMRAASRRPTRQRIAVLQLVLMVAAVVVAGYGHLRLMRRTTELTGQTFGGFP